MIFPPYTNQTKLVAIICLCAVAFALGWRVHGWKTEAGVAHSVGKTQKAAKSVQKKIEPIVTNKQNEIVRTEYVYKTIREKINEADDQRICFSDANAWSLYNSAITGTTTPGPEFAGKTARDDNAKGQGDESSSTQQIVATVDQVLNNAADNYETCRKNSIKHNALIDAVMVIKEKMCYCSE